MKCPCVSGCESCGNTGIILTPYDCPCCLGTGKHDGSSCRVCEGTGHHVQRYYDKRFGRGRLRYQPPAKPRFAAKRKAILRSEYQSTGNFAAKRDGLSKPSVDNRPYDDVPF